MSRRLKKVSYSGTEVKIVAIDQGENGDELVVSLKSFEEPHEDLKAGFRLLEGRVREILMLPDDWCDGGITVTGLTMSWSETAEVKGAVITGRAQLESAQSPFSFNTPHLQFEPSSETSNAPLMPGGAQVEIDALEQAALDYLDGKRAQGDLFEDGEAA